MEYLIIIHDLNWTMIYLNLPMNSYIPQKLWMQLLLHDMILGSRCWYNRYVKDINI